MRTYPVRDRTGRVTVERESDALVGSVFSLMQTVEFVHRECRLCEADEDHTNEHARLASLGARTRGREP